VKLIVKEKLTSSTAISVYDHYRRGDTILNQFVQCHVDEIRRRALSDMAGGRRDLTRSEDGASCSFAKSYERNYCHRLSTSVSSRHSETIAAVATGSTAFWFGCRQDRTIFPEVNTKLTCLIPKLRTLFALWRSQFTRTDIDSIGRRLSSFSGPCFGELDILHDASTCPFQLGSTRSSKDDYVLDPTAGSGGFLLEALLQTWHKVDKEFVAAQTNQQGQV